MPLAEADGEPDAAAEASSGSDDPEALAAGVRRGDVWATSRLITLAELEDPRAGRALGLLQPHTGRAHIVGITGVPGGGKSTLVGQLITVARAAGLQVGVLAVDPSSPFTGGAILADRLRMRSQIADDPGTFVRSLSSRSDLGGLSAVTWDAARIMDASGRDVIFIETVGAGQAETEIAAGANTVVVVTVPGLGDSIQAMKAGLMEIADILVVNMADRPGVRETVRALRSGVRPLGHDPSPWKVPILTTEAVAGRGVEELWATIVSHREHLQATGAMADRRLDQARAELLKRLERRWGRHLRGRLEQDELLTRLAEQVASGGLGVHDAVGLLWDELVPSE